MAVETITTRRFTCDHCSKVAVFDSDGEAGKNGWAILEVNGRGYSLCREDYDYLKTFLNRVF